MTLDAVFSDTPAAVATSRNVTRRRAAVVGELHAIRAARHLDRVEDLQVDHVDRRDRVGHPVGDQEPPPVAMAAEVVRADAGAQPLDRLLVAPVDDLDVVLAISDVDGHERVEQLLIIGDSARAVAHGVEVLTQNHGTLRQLCRAAWSSNIISAQASGHRPQLFER